MAIKMYDLAGAEAERRFSPYCWRIKMALAHKGLEVETVPWRFTDKQAIAFSGQDRVPVIVDGERVISDSGAIAGYLEDTYPQRPSLFDGPGGRASSLFISNWTEATVHTGLMRFVLHDIFRHIADRDKEYFRSSREARIGTTLEAYSAERDKYVESFTQSLGPLRRTLRAQNFIGGDHPLYPDYIVFGAFQWARSISPFKALEPSDPVFAWRERMLDLFGGLARKSPGYPV